MVANSVKIIGIIVLVLFSFNSKAICQKRAYYCLDGPTLCDGCGVANPLCSASFFAHTLKWYIFCNSCTNICTEPESTGDGEGYKSCGNVAASENLVDSENALFFELDLSDSYDELDRFASAHPEQAIKLLMYAREYTNSEMDANLTYTKSTSSQIPSLEFYQLVKNNGLDKFHENNGMDGIKNISTQLNDNTILTVESWASKLPQGNIEIRTRSVISEVIHSEVENTINKLGSTENNPSLEVKFKPLEVLGESVAIIEPVEGNENLYRMLSLEW